MRTHLFGQSLLLVLASASLAMLPACGSPPAPDAIFLIVVDTLRPDRLSCYGYTAHSTPYIDELAAGGVRFDNAQAVSSWTVPSMGAMMTSQYPARMGLLEEPAPGKRFEGRIRRKQISYDLPAGEPTLAEILRDAGFHTAAFVNQAFLAPHNGFYQGFVEGCRPMKNHRIEWIDPESEAGQSYLTTSDAVEADEALCREFESWLADHSEGKTFAWLHLLTPHRPYDAPFEYRGTGRLTQSQRYDAEIRALDDIMGIVTGAIERHVGFDRSLVVFTSDHGEEFGEHGGEEHGHSLHREVLRVPLIVRSPALASGRHVDTVVRTIDILPTILDLAGVEMPIVDAKGESLVPVASGRGGDRDVYAEGILYGYTKRSLITGRTKLILEEESDRVLLYDLSSDPLETSDVAGDRPDRVRDMQVELYRLRHGALEEFAEHVDQGEIKGETEDHLKALRALGYIK